MTAATRRHRLYRTPAIVLKRMDLGEADRILTLFTRDYGKLRAVAKGVRRTTSRSAGHLEPFAVADLLLAQGRELDVVSQAEMLSAFRRVREDLTLTSYAFYLVELMDLLTEDRSESPAAFSTLAESLTALEAGADPRLVAVQFQMRMLDLAGFRPELHHCVACRARIAPGGNQYSARLGGALCPECGPREASARPIEDPVLKLLRHVQRTDGRHHLAVPEAVSREAELVLRRHAESVAEREMRSPQFVARVQQAAAQAGL